MGEEAGKAAQDGHIDAVDLAVAGGQHQPARAKQGANDLKRDHDKAHQHEQRQRDIEDHAENTVHRFFHRNNLLYAPITGMTRNMSSKTMMISGTA